MKRSLQEVVELVIFGLVALLVGTALVWVLGWVLSLGGALLKALAGLLWLLLRFIVPIAIVAGLVYFLVKALQGRQGGASFAGAGSEGSPDAVKSDAQSSASSAQAGAGDVVDKVKEAGGKVVDRVKEEIDKARGASPEKPDSAFTEGEVTEAAAADAPPAGTAPADPAVVPDDELGGAAGSTTADATDDDSSDDEANDDAADDANSKA